MKLHCVLYLFSYDRSVIKFKDKSTKLRRKCYEKQKTE